MLKFKLGYFLCYNFLYLVNQFTNNNLIISVFWNLRYDEDKKMNSNENKFIFMNNFFGFS